MSDRRLTRTRLALFAACLGLYLTVHGYQSREGDQAYRLPLLLHRQNPALYAADPFVRAFDTFNPHVGYLGLLDATSRLAGLSPALLLLYVGMYALACVGLDKLARAAWPSAGPFVGVWAVALVLLARAGNIGTNHLFESTLLDRGIGFALGWLALGAAVQRPGRGAWVAAVALGLAALVHPSVGLQLALLLTCGLVAWCLAQGVTGVSLRQAGVGIVAIAAAMLPAIALQGGQSARLFEGLPLEEFRLLAAQVQSPQHMLPHLWRTPQWLAWGTYFVLAGLAFFSKGGCEGETRGWPAARVRLALLLVVNLAGLAAAYLAIEVLHDLRVTVFQPFRMATVARGLALVLVADRVRALWLRRNLEGQARAILVMVGLTGDWPLVVAAVAELAFEAGGWIVAMLRGASRRRLAPMPGALLLCAGLVFLARHDTERGHVRLLAGLGVAAALAAARSLRSASELGPAEDAIPLAPRRLAWAVALAWLVPVGALVATCVPAHSSSSGDFLNAFAAHCRFAERPGDDIERLAVWCRDHTPADAVFVGPPGPKTFRLWSQRSLAFNRSASPYHAAGLADWSARFRDHVGFNGNIEEFARSYLSDRQALERRYNDLTDDECAALALRQGARYVIAAAPADAEDPHPNHLPKGEGVSQSPLPSGEGGRRPGEGLTTTEKSPAQEPPLPPGEGGRRPGEGASRVPSLRPRSKPDRPTPSPQPSPGGRGSELRKSAGSSPLELLHAEGRYAVYRVREVPSLATSNAVTNH